MKSTLGKISGMMISLVIVIASLMILKQVGAQNESQIYNENASEPIAFSDSLENATSQISQLLTNIFNVSVVERILITDVVERNAYKSLTEQQKNITEEGVIQNVSSTTIFADAEPNPVKLSQNTILWCDYRNASDGYVIPDANVKFEVDNETFETAFNNNSQRYEHVYNFTTLGAKIVYCFASAEKYEDNSTSFTMTVEPPISVPSIRFVYPTPDNNFITSNSWVYINVSLDESGSAILEFDGSNETMLGTDTSFYLNQTDLSIGKHWYRVFAQDLNDSWNVSETMYLEVSLPTINHAESRGNVLGEFYPSDEIKIESQDYIDKYINWKFTKINNTHWLVNFNLNTDFLNNAKDLSNIDNFCNKYLKEYCNDSKAKSKLLNDLKSFKKYPLTALTDSIKVEKSEIDISSGSGSFYLIFSEGFKPGEKAKFGFGSTIISTTTTAPFYPNQRAICRDGSNNLHVAWLYNQTTIKYAYSTNDGVSFTSNDLNNTLSVQKGTPHISCNGNNITIAYATNQSNITIYNSSNNGVTWSFQVLRSNVSSNGFVNVERRGQRIYVVYECKDGNCGGQGGDTSYKDMVFFNSSDSGNSWGSDSVILDGYYQTVSGGHNSYNFYSPSLVVNGTGSSNDELFVVAQDYEDTYDTVERTQYENYYIQFLNSSNSGASWTNPTTGMVDDSTSNYPSITFDNSNSSNLFITFYQNNFIEFSNSINKGVSWSISSINTTNRVKSLPIVTVGSSNKPMVLWQESYTNYNIVYRVNQQIGWSEQANFTPDNNATYVNTKWNNAGGTDIVYMNGTSSPYSITYGSFNSNINNCRELNQPGFSYYLTADIVNNYSTCFNISANSVTLDCQNHLVGGNQTPSTYGIDIYRSSATNTFADIRNCNVNNWTGGISLSYAYYNNFTNITSTGSDYGLYVTYSNNNTFTNINSNNNTGTHGYGIYLAVSSYNSITNVISNNNTYGFRIDFGSNYNIIANANLINNSYGVYLVRQIVPEPQNNTITKSIIRDSGTAGIQINLASNNSFYNNLFNNTNNVLFTTTSNNTWNITQIIGGRAYSFGNIIGGNYWTNSTGNGYSDTCTDIDANGFCDQPYDILNNRICTIGVNCSNNTDYLPYSKDFPCDIGISAGVQYNITQSNKKYCLLDNSYVESRSRPTNELGAITFNNNVINSTLDCLLFNLTGNKSSGFHGVYFYYVSNNTVKNCFISNFSSGIKSEQSNTTVISNNTAYANTNGIICYSNSYNNTIYNNTAYSNDNSGIYVTTNYQPDIIENITKNIVYNNLYGIRTFTSNNSNIANNTAYSNTNGIYIDSNSIYSSINNNNLYNNAYGIYLSSGSSYSFIINSTLYNNTYGIGAFGTYNNITNGTIHNNTYDYYQTDKTNYFRNTNFTDIRKIYFDSLTSWFSYNNQSSGELWIKTNNVNAATITRLIINFSPLSFVWNDTTNASANANYTIEGLYSNVYYKVKNNSIMTYPSLYSGTLGTINFTINLPNGEQHKMEVYTSFPQYTFNSINSSHAGTPVEFDIKWNDPVSLLSGYIFSIDNCTGSWQAQPWSNSGWESTPVESWVNKTFIINSTLGCIIRWNVTVNNTANNWGYFNSNFTTVPNYCDLAINPSDLPYTLSQNNTYYCLANDVLTSLSTNAIVSVNTENSTLDCFGHLINNTNTGSGYGINFENVTNITLKNCSISNFQYGTLLNSTNNSNIFNNTIGSNFYGIWISGFSNNITDVSIYSNSNLDYLVANYSNYFRNTNFTDIRKIYFDSLTSWFSYNNQSSGEIWLKTNNFSTTNNFPMSYLSRILYSFNSNSVIWRDSPSVISPLQEINYTLILEPNKKYSVYNDSVLLYSNIQTGSNGLINFSIHYQNSGEQHTIEVSKKPPQWSNPQNYTPTNYSPTTLSKFNITWTDNLVVDKVYITISNSTTILINNASMDNTTYGSSNIWNYSIVLPAGAWNWTSYANNTNGDWNSTGNINILISKADNNVTLIFRNSTNEYINQNMTITYPDYANATGLTYVGNSYLFRGGANVTSEARTNVYLSANENGYAYRVNSTGNQNYTDNTTGGMYYLIINKASPSANMHIAINNSETDQIKSYPNATNVTGWEANTGDGGCSYNLYRNDSSTSNPELLLLGVGNYTYIYNTSGCSNYTSGSVTRILNISKGNLPPVIKNITLYSENLGGAENYTIAVNYVPTNDSWNYTDNDISSWYFDAWGQQLSFSNTSLVLNLTKNIIDNGFPFSKNLTITDSGNLNATYNITVNLTKSGYYQNETGTANRTYQLIARNATWTNSAPTGYAINITWNFSSPSGAVDNVTSKDGTFTLSSGSSQTYKAVWYGDWIQETNESWRQDIAKVSVANSTAYVTHSIWLNNSWNFTINNLNIEEYLTNRTDVASWNCIKALTINVPGSMNTTYHPINCSAGNIIQPLSTSNWNQYDSQTTVAGGYAYVQGKPYFNNTDSITYANVTANASSYNNETLRRDDTWLCVWNDLQSEADLILQPYSSNSTLNNYVICNKTNEITKNEYNWTADNSTEQNITYQKITKKLNGTNTDPLVTYYNVNASYSQKTTFSNYNASSPFTISNIAANGGTWEKIVSATNNSSVITTNWTNGYANYEFYQNITINDTDNNVTFYNLTGWSNNFDDSPINTNTAFMRYWNGTGWTNITPSSISDCSNYEVKSTQNGTFYVCMKDINSNNKADYFKFKIPTTSAPQTLQVGGFNQPPYYSIAASANYSFPKAGEYLKLYSQWQDDSNLSAYVFEWNASGTYSNVSSAVITGLSNWTNETQQIPVNRVAGDVINYRFYVNDSNNVWNSTNNNFLIWGWSNVSWKSPASGNYNHTQILILVCRVTDANTSTGIAGYNVSFWRNEIFFGSNLTDSDGNTSIVWNTTGYTIGLHSWKCNITNNGTLYYNVSVGESTAYLTVLDTIAPNVTNMTISPSTLEAHYNYTNITVNSTDDTSVDKVWAEITLPNSTKTNVTLSLVSGNLYRGNYTPVIGGTHNVTVYANDTYNNLNSTSGNFSVIGTTTGVLLQVPYSATQTPPAISAIEMNRTYNFTFLINVTLNNTGAYPNNGTMRSVNIFNNTAMPLGTYTNSTNEVCQNITAGGNCNKSFEISVSTKASRGSTPSISLNSTWQNPDYSIGNSANFTYVYVSTNTILYTDKNSISSSVNHSTSMIVDNFTIYPWGNTGLNNIEVNELDGNLSEAWVTFYNYSITDVSPWNIPVYTSDKFINVNVSMPTGQDPGLYWANFTINATGSLSGSNYNCTPSAKCWKFLMLNITVPENTSWIVTPNETDIIVPVGLNASFTSLIESIGNVNKTWATSHDWVVDPHVNEEPEVNCPSSVFVEKSTSQNVTCNVSGGTGGNYTYRLTFINTSSNPISNSIYVNMEVLDPPPGINNPNVFPSIVDQNYGYATINASISDNIQIDKAWISIINPDSTKENITYNVGSSSYSLSYNYVPNQTGVYYVRIYANDTATPSGVNQSRLFNFTSIGTTTVGIDTNVTNPITIYGITQDQGNSSAVVNISLNNTGQAKAYWLNRSLSLPNGWSTNLNIVSFGNLTSGTFVSNASTITVPSATTAGDYAITARTNWTNPDKTSATNTTSFTVTVAPNPVLSIVQPSVNFTLNHGSFNSTYFTINSTGNSPVSSININCASGSNCTNLSIAFNESSISSLNVLSTRIINVSAAAPLGLSSGNYLITINASGIGTSDTVTLNITVPENKTWNRNPSSLNQLTVGLNSQGTLGVITINNTGNTNITFNVATAGNGTSNITTNVSSLNVNKLSQGFVGVSYTTSSDIAGDEEIRAINITITNSSADPVSLNTTASIRIIAFKVNITSPNQYNQSSVRSGETITVNANATYGGTLITDNLTWNVTVNSVQCPVSSYTYNSIWIITCTAPSLTDATNYTLGVVSNYTTYNALATDSESNAVFYIDVTPPSIIPYANATPIGSNASIRANITDNLAVSGAIAEVTYPNSTKQNFTMSNISLTTWEYNLTSVSFGDYDVKVYSNDTTNNWNTNTTWFEVYDPLLALFNGTALDAVNSPISITFNLYRPSTATKLYNFSSNASGNYSQQINKRYYDFNILEFNNTINLTNVSITGNISNAILSDSIPVSQIGSGTRISKAAYVQTVLNYTNALLVLNYSGTSYTAENYLGVYRCSNWSFSGRSCTSSWTRINSTLSTTLKTLTVSTTDLSGAYAAAEFICGDGSCETVYGESNAVCPTDCPAPSATPGPSPGPTGGGGGGGGTPTKPTENQPTTPLSLSTSLIELTLYPGEYQLVSIGVTNNKNAPAEVSLSVDGDIWPFTLFENDTIAIGSGQTQYAKIRFFTMPTTTPGVYNGNIIIKSGDTTQKIPVILRIEYEREKMLDVKVEAVTKEVMPGQQLKYQVTLYNLGLTKRVDVFINYTVKFVENEKIIAVNQETMAVETSLSFLRSIDIPTDSEQGLYTIEADAWYENKSASSVASFNVVKPLWIFSLLLAIFTNWITYIILFVAIPCLYFGWKAYDKWKMARKVRARYVRPINMGKLPTKGLWLGKIAETNSNAFFDEDKLTTHMIIAGGTGSGKSVAGMVMAEECLKKGIPVIVFDPTAQWTGFVRSCRDKAMLTLYPKFGIKQEEARGFKGTLVQVKDPFLKVEVEKYIKEGEVTVFVLNKLTPDQLDYFVRKTIDYMFTIPWEESRQLKALVVFDEVHRLLPKYSKQVGATIGGGEGYLSIERACREFRKWGLGLMMLSQVLLDFRGAIRAVIATESQMRTKYEGDIERIKTKYGWEYSTAIPKLEVGAGMIQNPEYNEGKPWFVKYRPLLHDTFRLTEEELNKYEDHMKEIEELNKKIETLKSRNIDTYDMELELKLALDKIKTAQMRMAETYIDSVKSRIKMVESRS